MDNNQGAAAAKTLYAIGFDQTTFQSDDYRAKLERSIAMTVGFPVRVSPGKDGELCFAFHHHVEGAESGGFSLAVRDGNIHVTERNGRQTQLPRCDDMSVPPDAHAIAASADHTVHLRQTRDGSVLFAISV